MVRSSSAGGSIDDHCKGIHVQQGSKSVTLNIALRGEASENALQICLYKVFSRFPSNYKNIVWLALMVCDVYVLSYLVFGPYT